MNSTSVGELLIAGAQVGNNMKTRRRHNRNTQNITVCITHPKEAHLTEQTDQPRPGTANPEQGAHKECTGQRWAQTASNGVRPNPWMGRPLQRQFSLIFVGKIDLILQKAVISVPALISPRNRPIRTIKGASLTPLNTHHQGAMLTAVKS